MSRNVRRCRGCGSEMDTCSHCEQLPKRLSMTDVEEVLTFLRVNLDLQSELSIGNFLFSLCSETFRHTLHALDTPAPVSIQADYLPSASVAGLRSLIEVLIGSSSDEFVDDVIDLISEPSTDALYDALARLNLSWLARLLLVLHYNKVARFFPGSARAAVKEQYCRLWLRTQTPFETAITEIEAREGPDSSCLARLLMIEYRVDLAISNLGHTDLRTVADQRVIRRIHLGPTLPAPLQSLILCHELVHAALWLRRPYIRTGWHSNEEVFCHAAMLAFANTLSDVHPQHRKIFRHRAHLCTVDARRRDHHLFDTLSSLLSAQNTTIAITQLHNSISEASAVNKTRFQPSPGIAGTALLL